MPAPEFCTRCAESPNDLLLEGIDLFNRRLYFECHEVLEHAWNLERDAARATPGMVDISNLYKGILQVGVGCFHLLRGNYRGAMIKLRTGAEYLEPFAPACLQVVVGQLIADAHHLRQAVEAAGPEHTAAVDRALLPKVHLVGELEA